MTEETTSEQLAEIEGQTESTPVTEYTPPEGWRVVAVGEVLQPGDHWVNWEGTESRPDILHGDGTTASGGRYIRRIKPEPQPEPEPQQYTPPEGWRVVHVGEELRQGDVRVDDSGAFSAVLVTVNGVVPHGRRYIRPIEPQAEPEPEPQPESDAELQAQVAFLKGREVTLGTRLQQEREVTTRLRGELESVQNLLGESRQRVTQLEELVGSLRTINEAQEKAFEAAGKENTALRNQLAAVKAELASVAADRQRLRVELDAAQQVPADSPEMRQLRADLADMTQDRDTYRHAHELLLNDVNATHQRTKVMTIEAIVEWLVPIRTCGSQALATAVISNLPHIMRSLTGLEDEEIE